MYTWDITLISQIINEITQLGIIALYKSVCPSVLLSVGPSVRNAIAFQPTRSDFCRVYGLVALGTFWKNLG